MFTFNVIWRIARVKRIFENYEQASGQVINFHKSGIASSSNMPATQAAIIQNFFSVNEVPNNQKYLGVPFVLHKSKIKVFGFLKNELQDRLQSWKAKV